MTEILHLTLLGTPQILLGNQPLTGFAAHKAQALLFYLAVTAYTHAPQTAPHNREAIATLLWGELTDAEAKQNLRNVLPNLRHLVGDYLRIERQTVAFDRTSPHWLDVAVLRRSLPPGQPPVDLAVRQAAVELYKGEFLAGFYVREAPLFEAWVSEQREQLHTLVVNELTALVGEYVQTGDVAAALAATRRLLVLEPWSEPTHRQQMMLLAQTGERAAALAQYETCRRVSAAEFGIAPLPETTALYEQIRSGERGRQGDQGDQGQGEKVASPKTNEQRQDEQTDPGLRTSDSGLTTPVAGYNLPLRTKLYGRQAELTSLQKWVIEEGCHLVGIFGIGGQGKTVLAATFVRGLAEAAPQTAPGVRFHHILWQSLLNAPPLTEVLQEWVAVLSDHTVTSLPPSLDQQFSLLFAYLQRQRCLLILDNLESILQSEGRSGYYRPGYEGYEQLVRRLVEGQHRSCLLLTSRERPQDLTHLEEDAPHVRFLALTGLSTAAGQQKLLARGVIGDPASLAALVHQYAGNPLALNLVAETLQSVFAGDIAAFLQAETLIFDDIRDVLDQQFARLTLWECEVMLWLAIVREPVPFPLLRDLLAQPPAPRLVLEAVRSLQRRSLLEKFDEGFGLQNVVLEYATDLLIETISRELLEDKEPRAGGMDRTQRVPASGRRSSQAGQGAEDETHSASRNQQSTISHPQSYFNRYALVLAQAKEYVRASQTRLLLQPVAQLLDRLGRTGAEQRIRWLLSQLHQARPRASGYAAANLLHLALQLGSDLQGYDFSGLAVRQADLRQAQLRNVNLARADLHQSVFKETFGGKSFIAISADGQLLAATSGQGEVRVWRLADGQPFAIYEHPQSVVHGVAFSPDGRILASVCSDQQIYLWDRPDASGRGSLRARLKGHTAGVYQVAFSPDGQLVASGGSDQRIIVWELASGQPRQVLPVKSRSIRALAFSPDGQRLACNDADCALQLWDVTTERLLHLCEGHTAKVTAVAFSPDGRVVASGSDDCTVRLWAVESGELWHTFPVRADFVLAVAFSPDGRRLASAGDDRLVTLWTLEDSVRAAHPETGTPWVRARARILPGHQEPIWSIAFTPDGQTLVSSGLDNTLRLWDVATGQLLRLWQGQAEWHDSVAFHPDGQLLASGGIGSALHLWDVAQRTTPTSLPGHQRQITRVAFSPDGQTLASASGDQTIRLWDVRSRQLRAVLYGHEGWVQCVTFSPDGQTLASASGDQTIRLWDVVTGQTRQILKGHTNTVWTVAFSPTGEWLASVSNDQTLRIWDSRGQLRRVIQHGATPTFVAFSLDGLLLATCSSDQLIIRLWEVVTGRLCQTLHGHTDRVLALVFSPDGQSLFSSSADRTIGHWNLADGRLLRTLRGHHDLVLSLAVDRRGEHLASGSADGTIRLWDMQTAACVQVLRAEGPYAGMNITGITSVTEAQKAALKALGAVEE